MPAAIAGIEFAAHPSGSVTMAGLEELEKRDDQERSAGAIAGAAPVASEGADTGTPGEPPARRGPGRPRGSSSKGTRGRKPGRSRKGSRDRTAASSPAVSSSDEATPEAPVQVPMKALSGAIGGSVDLVTRIASRGAVSWNGEELEEWGDLWAPVLAPYLSVLGRGGPLAVALLGSANLLGRKFAGVSAPPAIAASSSEPASDTPTPPAANTASGESPIAP